MSTQSYTQRYRAELRIMAAELELLIDEVFENLSRNNAALLFVEVPAKVRLRQRIVHSMSKQKLPVRKCTGLLVSERGLPYHLISVDEKDNRPVVIVQRRPSSSKFKDMSVSKYVTSEIAEDEWWITPEDARLRFINVYCRIATLLPDTHPLLDKAASLAEDRRIILFERAEKARRELAKNEVEQT